MNAVLLERIFWILVSINVLGFAALFLFGLKQTGPDSGMVGVWLVGIPMLAILASIVVFLMSSNQGVRGACLVVLGLPIYWAVLVSGDIVNTKQRKNAEALDYAATISGDRYFPDYAQRNLTHAIYLRDVARVKAALPAAGDLNKAYLEDQTLFRFAMQRANESDEAVEIVRAMLAAGADPNSGSGVPLELAIAAGPRMTELLLQAGADPNAGKPAWWSAIRWSGEQDPKTLLMLLDHGADLEKRDGSMGPVGLAASEGHWRIVTLLIERGAEWKGDVGRNGSSVEVLLDQAIGLREGESVPEELRRLKAIFQSK